ncbi:MAG: hypothetical protein AAFP00_18025 [Bacteroidota bacterium]
MEKIEVGYKKVAGLAVYHKYILYTNAQGDQFFARGGPAFGPDGYQSRNPGNTETEGPYRPLGDLVTEYGPYADSPLSPDWDDSVNDPGLTPHHRELIETASDLSSKFQDIIDAMDDISAENHLYEIGWQNSNSAVDTALSRVGGSRCWAY